MIIVDLLAATICFAGQCYPVLVGPKTQTGTYHLSVMKTNQKFYGGDVLVFNDRGSSVDAIHRVWLGDPKQRRMERLKANDPNQRRSITNGCINLMPEVYEKLKDCCSNGELQIVKGNPT
jgi:hypothetical protein